MLEKVLLELLSFQMDLAPMFSFFFFFMLILLALSSACGAQEAVIMAILDEFPVLRKKRIFVTIGICFISFLGGILMCFDSGFLFFTLIDARAGNALALMGLVEITVSNWLHGVRNLFIIMT